MLPIFIEISFFKNSMKIKAAIAGGIALAVVVVVIAVLYPAGDNPVSDQKYQYKFWQQQLEFEDNKWFNRVLFSYSHNYGTTFSKPVDMSMTDLNAHEPKMIIMDGDVILVWRAEQPRLSDDKNLFFAKSTDHGENFATKSIFFGAYPDIKYYDDRLYLTWTGNSLAEIWYSDSFDRGKTFSEPILLFEIDWELSPYDPKPIPELEVYADRVTVSWKMRNHDDGNSDWIVWNAVDHGKDRTFEIIKSALDE